MGRGGRIRGLGRGYRGTVRGGGIREPGRCQGGGGQGKGRRGGAVSGHWAESSGPMVKQQCVRWVKFGIGGGRVGKGAVGMGRVGCGPEVGAVVVGKDEE